VDFERVLKALLEAFDRQEVRYAAVGGFALGVLGAPRATLDLDFLVHRDDLAKLDATLRELGYRRFGQTVNVTKYVHPDRAWGSLDFIHAFRKISLEMLARAKRRPILNGTQSLPVADPEDLIGLKVQAIANNPDRQHQERADIERLMALYGKQLDWSRVQGFYELFNLGEEATQLRRRFGNVE